MPKFPKKTSGNPGGRPKGKISEIRAIALGHAEEMMRLLVELARDDKARPADRRAAAEAVLDRGGVNASSAGADAETSDRKINVIIGELTTPEKPVGS